MIQVFHGESSHVGIQIEMRIFVFLYVLFDVSTCLFTHTYTHKYTGTECTEAPKPKRCCCLSLCAHTHLAHGPVSGRCSIMYWAQYAYQ